MKKLTCIVCPNSCDLTVEKDSDGQLRISGNECKRGEEFAFAEMTHPMRTVTSTVRTVFPEAVVAPVRVSGEIPKERIFDVMKEINEVTVNERIPRGTAVITDVLGLGADVIITSNILTEGRK